MDDLRNDPRYKKHESRPDLAGEHPQGDFYQLIAMLLFLAAIAADYFLVGLGPRLNDQFNFWTRLVLGGAIVMFGGWLALYGIKIVFSEYTEQPRMITRQLFSVVRHPVYLGVMIIYVGALAFTMSPLGLAVFVGVFLLYDWLAEDEEQRMINTFGEAYLAYKSRVPRWLPRRRAQREF
jgi:protein-S-isoprenylcysteine O-methyltransferase Ste14